MMRYLSSVTAVMWLLLALPVQAQEAAASGDSDRIDQLEQDMLLLKRQQERLRTNGNIQHEESDDAPQATVGTAQTNVRISALEQEIKKLRGQLEEKDFSLRRLSEDLERIKRDTEFRLNDLEKRTQTAATASTPTQGATESETGHPPITTEAPTPSEEPKSAETKAEKKKAELSVKDASTEHAPEDAAAESAPPGDTPRDHYNYAFRLLNQNQYEQAADSFARFVTKFPNDPLVGNAHYWQGETYYIRKNFSKAADQFRQGFEALPTGPKAADNLLKLGMSLGILKKKEEACVVLSQVVAKFKTASANVATKAQAEHQRLGCE